MLIETTERAMAHCGSRYILFIVGVYLQLLKNKLVNYLLFTET